MLGVCTVWPTWFFPKFIIKPIGICFLIIRTNTYRLGSVFRPIALWFLTVCLINLVSLKHSKNYLFFLIKKKLGFQAQYTTRSRFHAKCSLDKLFKQTCSHIKQNVHLGFSQILVQSSHINLFTHLKKKKKSLSKCSLYPPTNKKMIGQKRIDPLW